MTTIVVIGPLRVKMPFKLNSSKVNVLPLSMQGKNFQQTPFWNIFFLFYPENGLWYSMQIVSTGNNLHEISKPIFWEKQKKYHPFVVCWICAKRMMMVNGLAIGIKVYAITIPETRPDRLSLSVYFSYFSEKNVFLNLIRLVWATQFCCYPEHIFS